jgi:hypothetical protein
MPSTRDVTVHTGRDGYHVLVSFRSWRGSRHDLPFMSAVSAGLFERGVGALISLALPVPTLCLPTHRATGRRRTSAVAPAPTRRRMTPVLPPSWRRPQIEKENNCWPPRRPYRHLFGRRSSFSFDVSSVGPDAVWCSSSRRARAK